jgi:hydroxymethylglutaryl-CoA lyase
MTASIQIHDVSARDGLQNEKNNQITTADKLRLIDGLVEAGIQSVELTAFVNPKAVPMMADAAEVARTVRQKYPDLHATGLVFNEKGFETASSCNMNAIALVLIIPDALSRSNTGQTAADWIDRQAAIIQQAKSAGLWVRAYLAGAWVCPYDGAVAPDAVLRYADRFAELQVDELCPTDPIGHAHPAQVRALLSTMAGRYPAQRLAVHLHDTLAFGLANAFAAFEAGIRIFDTSIGGLGGCPFAPGSAGNLATEDLLLLAQKMGIHTGVDLHRINQLVQTMAPVVGRDLGGRTHRWYLNQASS